MSKEKKVKLLIEIDEGKYDHIKNGCLLSVEALYNAIANGIPYNPSGDSISREALKNDISEKVCDKFERWNKTITCAEFETFIRDVIDDAPTVELSPVINMKPLTKEERQGLIDAFKKSRLTVVKLDDERPQGEWARHDEWVNGEYVGGFYHVNCPVIEEGYALYSRWETCFCPNCGAPMLKGGDET